MVKKHTRTQEMSLPPNMDAPARDDKRWIVIEKGTNAVLTHVFARLWFDARQKASVKLRGRAPEEFIVKEDR